MSRRLDRVNELLKREIADDLFRLINDSPFDLAALTITRVNVAPNLRHARVMVSIRDHAGQEQQMLAELRRHRHTLQQSLNKHMCLKYTPQLSFELDHSIENGDRVLTILSELEAEDEHRELSEDE